MRRRRSEDPRRPDMYPAESAQAADPTRSSWAQSAPQPGTQSAPKMVDRWRVRARAHDRRDAWRRGACVGSGCATARRQSCRRDRHRVAAHVTPAVNGPVTIEIDRFDPVEQWQFYRVYHVQAVHGVARIRFLPPDIGRWRALARTAAPEPRARRRAGPHKLWWPGRSRP